MRNLLSTLLFSSSLLACTTSNSPSDGTGTTAGNVQSAQDAVDSTDATSAEGNMMMAAIDGGADASSGGNLGGAAVSAKLSANLSARFTPPGCVTVTPDAAALKAVFADCTGPRGLVHVTGELDLSASISLQGAITVKGTSSDLQVNGAQLEINATGTYAVTATGHTLTVATSSTGTGAHGNAIDHAGNYTIAWDPATQCRTIDGQWSTELGAATRSSTVDVSQCGTGCPTGSISHAFVDGKTLTVTFDGTATAAWSLAATAAGGVSGPASGSASGSAATSGSLTLACK